MTFPTIQRIGLALSIIIVLNLFFSYGIRTFYKQPVFDDYCGEQLRGSYTSKDACEAVGGRWYPDGGPKYYPGGVPVEPSAYCDATATCQERFQEVDTVYKRNVFIAMVLLGLVAIIASLTIVTVGAVSTGLLYGGVVALFIGAIQYWSNMDEYLRFVILGITLAVLIVVGYKRLADTERS